MGKFPVAYPGEGGSIKDMGGRTEKKSKDTVIGGEKGKEQLKREMPCNSDPATVPSSGFRRKNSRPGVKWAEFGETAPLTRKNELTTKIFHTFANRTDGFRR